MQKQIIEKRLSHRALFIALILFITFNFDTIPSEKLCAQESRSITDIQHDASKKIDTTYDMLRSSNALIDSIRQKIGEKRNALKENPLSTDQESIQKELAIFDQQLKEAESDFESIATGIDIHRFDNKNLNEPFDWQNELLSIVEPMIKELKLFTLRARQKTKLKEEILYYDNVLPTTQQAIENLDALLIRSESNKALQKRLSDLHSQWVDYQNQMENRRNLISMQLNKMEAEEESLVTSSREALKGFVKTRGFYLAIAFGVCILVVLSLWIVHYLLMKILPGHRLEFRPFYIRVIDLFFRISMVVFSVLALIFVFYYAEDWGLLSLTIVFILGLIWALKQSIPKLWKQSCLMLNIGSVREGERIIYHGVPWLVQGINVYCQLKNPALDVTIRLPIEELIGNVSRPVKKGEPWFPCKKKDWVILSDGIRGKVTSLSHEMVELVQRGGAAKTYQTQDFLGLSPLNLSRNFRLKVIFGIAYAHQKVATSEVLQKMGNHLTDCIEKEGYTPHLLNLRVEFCQAGASSLDLVVIADFDGEMAPLYNRLNRAIQRWCVDACTTNGWEIPFPQLTVHKGA